MSATFMTPVLQAKDSNATGLRVPAEVVVALGAGKRPKVIVSRQVEEAKSPTTRERRIAGILTKLREAFGGNDS